MSTLLRYARNHSLLGWSVGIYEVMAGGRGSSKYVKCDAATTKVYQDLHNFINARRSISFPILRATRGEQMCLHPMCHQIPEKNDRCCLLGIRHQCSSEALGSDGNNKQPLTVITRNDLVQHQKNWSIKDRLPFQRHKKTLITSRRSHRYQ